MTIHDMREFTINAQRNDFWLQMARHSRASAANWRSIGNNAQAAADLKRGLEYLRTHRKLYGAPK